MSFWWGQPILTILFCFWRQYVCRSEKALLEDMFSPVMLMHPYSYSIGVIITPPHAETITHLTFCPQRWHYLTFVERKELICWNGASANGTPDPALQASLIYFSGRHSAYSKGVIASFHQISVFSLCNERRSCSWKNMSLVDITELLMNDIKALCKSKLLLLLAVGYHEVIK